MTFQEKISLQIKKNNSLLCIGLDTDMNKIPEHLRKHEFPLTDFNKAIIDTTYNLVCCYKLQIAYYAALGIPGIQMLMQTIHYIHDRYTGIPVILDAKRGDIGSTAERYASEIFESLTADAATVNPYLGFDSLEPFLKWREKGVIILCRTSNKGATDFQDLLIDGKPLYLHVAEKVVAWNKQYGNCMLVVGATYPSEMKKIREVAPDMFFLVPGIGAQGGDLENTMKNGLIHGNTGLLIHAARSIIYASDTEEFAEKARSEAERLRSEINKYRIDK